MIDICLSARFARYPGRVLPRRFREILVHDNPKIVVDGDESAVQGPVQIGAKGEAVGDGIVSLAYESGIHRKCN